VGSRHEDECDRVSCAALGGRKVEVLRISSAVRKRGKAGGWHLLEVAMSCCF